MLTTLNVVLPTFALILLGFIARKGNLLGSAASAELNRFVVWLALPALLFDITAHTTWNEIFKPAFIVASAIGCGVVFVVALLFARLRGKPLADASIEGLNAGYANTGFVGYPLCMAVFGGAVRAPWTIAVILTAWILFAFAIVLIEIDLQTDARATKLMAKVLTSLAKNPLVVAPVLGAGAAASGLALPGGVKSFLDLLGGAASPVALVAMGLFLARETRSSPPNIRTVVQLIALKLFVQPLIVWVIADPLLRMSADATHMAVVLAALPTGTGPFMLAEFYGREADTTSSVILVSTILSLVTLSVYIGTM